MRKPPGTGKPYRMSRERLAPLPPPMPRGTLSAWRGMIIVCPKLLVFAIATANSLGSFTFELSKPFRRGTVPFACFIKYYINRFDWNHPRAARISDIMRLVDKDDAGSRLVWY